MHKKSHDEKGDVALGNELSEVVDVVSYALREDLITEYEVRRQGELPYALARYLHYIDLYGDKGAFVVGEKARVCLADSSRLVLQLVDEGMVRKEQIAALSEGAKAGLGAGEGVSSASSATVAKGRRKRGSPRAKLFLTDEGKQELAAVRRAWKSVGARIAKSLSAELPSERAVFVRVMKSLGKALGGTR